MENPNTSPINNVTMSEDHLIRDNHINEISISAVFSNKNSNGDEIMSTEDIEALMKSFPPGFRFYPTDYELIKHYLERKIANLPLQPNKIYEMNIYKYDPMTIAAYIKPTTEEKVWYVFTPRDRKYPNGDRPDRSAGNGYWKATGADQRINDDQNSVIGSRRALVYFYGKPGEKTDWMMHEYMLPKTSDTSNKKEAKNSKLDEWVLCKLYNKKDVVTTMFTQRKRSRENDEAIIDEVKHARHEQVRQDDPTNCNNNNVFPEGTYQNDPRNDPTNCNNNNVFSEGTYQNDPTNCNNNNVFSEGTYQNDPTNCNNNNVFSEGTYQNDPTNCNNNNVFSEGTYQNDPRNCNNNNVFPEGTYQNNLRNCNNNNVFSEGTYQNDPTNCSNNQATMFSEGTYQNDPTNCSNNQATMFSEGTYQNNPTNNNNNNNHAMILHPQVPTGLSTFPQYSHKPTFCNSQSCASQLINNGTASGFVTNDIFHHQIAPSPLMIAPIATNNSIGHDYTMNNDEFGLPLFNSCIDGCYGEYSEHDQYEVDQYFVNNYQEDKISSEHNTNNFVNGETSASKGDC